VLHGINFINPFGMIFNVINETSLFLAALMICLNLPWLGIAVGLPSRLKAE
jgi:hypothetical protein